MKYALIYTFYTNFGNFLSFVTMFFPKILLSLENLFINMGVTTRYLHTGMYLLVSLC